MTRIVKDYDERYAEFLDVAQGLFYTKGYEATSVQEIIRAVGVAKGTFYHYFDSKAELLESLVRQMFQHTLTMLEPLVTDEALHPVEKLKQLFTRIDNWKLTNREFMIDTARVLYADENVLLREKMRQYARETISPLIAQIIQEGLDASLFDVDYPLAGAELILSMSQSVSESALRVLLAHQVDNRDIERVRQQIIVYNRGVECVIGLDKGTLTLIEPDILDNWLK